MHHLLSRLPLLDENFEQLNPSSDVVDFVEYYTICLGDDELELFTTYVRKSNLIPFIEKAAPDLHAALVGSLKHTFAYSRILTALAGEDDVNAWGIPYLMEADTDIESALLLMSNGYHKPTLQMLRTALEASITHAYLTVIGVTYDDLPTHYIPPMKDRKRGMINRLVAIRVLTSEQARSVSTLYCDLSNATHSQYKYLHNKFEEVNERAILANTISIIRSVAICCITVMLQMTRLHLLSSDQYGANP